MEPPVRGFHGVPRKMGDILISLLCHGQEINQIRECERMTALFIGFHTLHCHSSLKSAV